MLELLHSIVHEVNTRKHLDPVIADASLTVQIEVEGEVPVLLIIEDGALSVGEIQDKEVDAYIEGDEDILKALLLGEILLREASQKGQLFLKSSFRTSLFLEAIFKLSLINNKALEL